MWGMGVVVCVCVCVGVCVWVCLCVCGGGGVMFFVLYFQLALDMLSNIFFKRYTLLNGRCTLYFGVNK